MRFRYINIQKMVFQLIRPDFALRYDYDPVNQRNRINYFTRIILAICYTLNGSLIQYYRHRTKWYMIAACTPTYGQIQRVLQYLYGMEYGDISITPSGAQLANSYLYKEDTPAKYLYTTDEPQIFWGQLGNVTEVPIVRLPQALVDSDDYEDFISTLNLLFPFHISYTLMPYNY